MSALSTGRWRPVLASAAFALQFVALDGALRGLRAWTASPRLAVELVASACFWGLLLLAATTRARRLAVAAAAAGLVVVPVFVHRYYGTPLDVQVAASALHAWRDVRPVLARALPAAALAWIAVAAVELALLELAHAAPPRPSRAALAAVAVLGALTLGATRPRDATPDLRGLHALSAVTEREPRAVTGSVALPPLHATGELPDVLLVLSESVRATDYVTRGEGATAPETVGLTPNRVDFAEMRAVSSYTAVSLSALITGRTQEGARESILRAPNVFDVARATRDPRGRRPAVAYVAAQSETVFEAKDVREATDRFVTVETFLGRDVADDAEYAELPLDREATARLEAVLGELRSPILAVLHLVGTHAPYFTDEASAPFQPSSRVVAWSGLERLHNTYRNAILAQDRTVARAVRAFVQHAGSRPWVVLFTSDHGEAFGEHGAIHHGQNLYDEQIHVPAWLAFSDGALSGEQVRALEAHRAGFVTHLDLLPTLLDLLGLGDNSALRDDRARMPGRSLLRPPVGATTALPVTNCTGMFPCPLDTWGVLEGDRKLVAQRWDGDWLCLSLAGGERAVGAADPACARMRQTSGRHFATLPNGRPNR